MKQKILFIAILCSMFNLQAFNWFGGSDDAYERLADFDGETTIESQTDKELYFAFIAAWKDGVFSKNEQLRRQLRDVHQGKVLAHLLTKISGEAAEAYRLVIADSEANLDTAINILKNQQTIEATDSVAVALIPEPESFDQVKNKITINMKDGALAIELRSDYEQEKKKIKLPVPLNERIKRDVPFPLLELGKTDNTLQIINKTDKSFVVAFLVSYPYSFDDTKKFKKERMQLLDMRERASVGGVIPFHSISLPQKSDRLLESMPLAGNYFILVASDAQKLNKNIAQLLKKDEWKDNDLSGALRFIDYDHQQVIIRDTQDGSLVIKTKAADPGLVQRGIDVAQKRLIQVVEGAQAVKDIADTVLQQSDDKKKDFVGAVIGNANVRDMGQNQILLINDNNEERFAALYYKDIDKYDRFGNIQNIGPNASWHFNRPKSQKNKPRVLLVAKNKNNLNKEVAELRDIELIRIGDRFGDIFYSTNNPRFPKNIKFGGAVSVSTNMPPGYMGKAPAFAAAIYMYKNGEAFRVSPVKQIVIGKARSFNKYKQYQWWSLGYKDGGYVVATDWDNKNKLAAYLSPNIYSELTAGKAFNLKESESYEIKKEDGGLVLGTKIVERSFMQKLTAALKGFFG